MNRVGRQMKSSSQLKRRDRPDAFHPAKHDGIERRVITTRQYCFDLRLMLRRHPSSSYFLRLTPHP